MTMSNTAVRRGGIGGLLAAALFLTSTVIDQLAPVQTPYVASTDYAHQAVLVVAFLGAAAAVIGLTVLLRRRGRFARLALVGAVLAGGGYIVVSLLSVNNLIQGERSLVTARLAAALALLVGSALLGVLVLITRTLPWWCGVLLIVAFPLGDVVNQLMRGGEGILLALLWAAVGIALLRRAGDISEADRVGTRPRQVVG
jgi:hypothetical protein